MLNEADATISGVGVTLGWAYYPGQNPGQSGSLSTVNGDSYNLSSDPNALNPGSYYYLTFTHELGHALIWSSP